VTRPLTTVLGAAVAVLMLFVAALPAGAASDVIVLPGASAAEGIATGNGNTFYAGDLFGGDIYRGDLRNGTASVFIDVPDGRMAAGMEFDARTGLLFVAGLATGQGYVYDTRTGATVAVYQFADPSESPLINDVAVTRTGAWFTDSSQARLFFVPLDDRVPGDFSTLPLSGPAAELSGQFNLNGIEATADGSTLIVSHSTNGSLYTIDPTTGDSALIANVSLPNVDGLVLQGHRLWAVQNFDNQIAQITLSPDLASGVVQGTITNSAFEVPTAADRHGNELAVVNAKFDTGFPPTATQFEVVVVSR
jgi:sugar lactone lactonase YvrE